MLDLIVHNFGKQRPSVKCLDHGFVTLVDVMPRISDEPEITTCDHAIVQAARVSYGDGTKKINEDKGLIRYLMRHRHTTPFEMIEFKFHCAMPIFVAREWIRHRTANVNEISGRYSVLPNKFYKPEKTNVRRQSTRNKQVSDGNVDSLTAERFLAYLDGHCEATYNNYLSFMDEKIGREQARMILPVNLYTEWYWKIDCWNMLHFLSLRCDEHAQQEIREFGEAMLSLVSPLIPWTIQAWNDYHPMRQAMTLTRLEIDAIQQCLKSLGISLPPIATDNKGENAEWQVKASRLGFV